MSEAFEDRELDADGSRLVVSRRAEGGDVTIGLRGELDLATLGQAERAVQEAEQEASGLLVVDLSALDFMDSSGVRLVLIADDRARTEGRRMAVCLGEGAPRRVFAMLGLLDKLQIVPVRPDDPPDATAQQP